MTQKPLGLSLIEAMIALGVLSVGALASTAMLANNQRSNRTITASSQYQESMTLLRLFLETVGPQACGDALLNATGGRPVVSWNAATTVPAEASVDVVRFDGRTLARVGSANEAFEFQALDLVELFPGLRAFSDSDSDGVNDRVQFTGQFRLRGQRVGDFLGRAALPEYSVPLVFSVRTDNNTLVSCRTVSTAIAPSTGGPSEQEVCEQTFGGVYDPNQQPRCVLSSLVLAANHAERANLINAAPAEFRSNTGALIPGTVLSVQSFASSRVSAAILGATSVTAASLDLSDRATIRNRLDLGYRDGSVNRGMLALRGRATLNGLDLCLENGLNCPDAPLPTPTPTPPPPPALASASYNLPGIYSYVVPPGAAGRVRVTILGAGGSGGCGNTRNGEGGRAGQLIQQDIVISAQATPQVFGVRVGRSEIACPTINTSGGTRGKDGESSQFDRIVAAGGRGGAADMPGSYGDTRCYPTAPEGFGEPGPLDSSRAQARPCMCNQGDVPATEWPYYNNAQPHGCPTLVAGAGGGGGGDNFQGGRGGHGLVMVTPF